MNKNFEMCSQWTENKSNLKEYAGLWVALCNGELLAHAINRDALFSVVQKEHPNLEEVLFYQVPYTYNSRALDILDVRTNNFVNISPHMAFVDEQIELQEGVVVFRYMGDLYLVSICDEARNRQIHKGDFKCLDSLVYKSNGVPNTVILDNLKDRTPVLYNLLGSDTEDFLDFLKKMLFSRGSSQPIYNKFFKELFFVPKY
jgi:hypothetical protein